MRALIRVLVAEDSPTARDLIVHVLDEDPAIRVVATAGSGPEAIEAAARCRPDLITMDIAMPGMDGYEATRRIMEASPVPIIIVTGSTTLKEVDTSFRALDAGALTVLQKPRGPGHPEHGTDAENLVRTVKLMAEVKVVKRWPRQKSGGGPAPVVAQQHAREDDVRIVVVGASTGGPPAIRELLAGLPNGFNVPVVIVQHMASGFIAGFADWLNETSSLPVQVASDGTSLLPGRVYVAPDGLQTAVAAPGRLSCTSGSPENGLRPSVAWLFRSVAEVYGGHAAAVLLTGMGKDGADELRLLREKGALTAAQDEESSVIFGMPGEAVRLNAADHVLPPAQIAMLLTKAVPGRSAP